MKKLLILFSVLILLLTGMWFYLGSKHPHTTPLQSASFYLEKITNPRPDLAKKSFGFLPYWRVDQTEHIRFNFLSNIDYFGLTIDENGEFIKEVNGETEPGWREWQSQNVKNIMTRSQIMGADTSISIISHVNSSTESFLDNPDAKERLITNILNEVRTRKLDGVNIDFEYLGNADPEYKVKFTEFSKDLKAKLTEENPDTKLFLSIMPYSTRSADILDLQELEPIYDLFIGMSYDFYGISADIAGPISPLTGFAENKYFFDTTTMYEDLTKQIPNEKILMGVAYYGWEWAVEDGKTIQSATLPPDNPDSYAAVISYARARRDKNINQETCSWDEYARESWCHYTDQETGIDYQVWIPDNRTMEERFSFANDKKLAGITIWVLGYDEDYPDLWDMMREKFN